eukprot:GHVU01195638.1.p2 GENE.GHVU01195638.1~~GHVU01195638.1.p2  ORF type:complete len:178 (+),score=53.74 GHVU01195638.1:518-1051(+)
MVKEAEKETKAQLMRRKKEKEKPRGRGGAQPRRCVGGELGSRSGGNGGCADADTGGGRTADGGAHLAAGAEESEALLQRLASTEENVPAAVVRELLQLATEQFHKDIGAGRVELRAVREGFVDLKLRGKFRSPRKLCLTKISSFLLTAAPELLAVGVPREEDLRDDLNDDDDDDDDE